MDEKDKGDNVLQEVLRWVSAVLLNRLSRFLGYDFAESKVLTGPGYSEYLRAYMIGVATCRDA